MFGHYSILSEAWEKVGFDILTWYSYRFKHFFEATDHAVRA